MFLVNTIISPPLVLILLIIPPFVLSVKGIFYTNTVDPLFIVSYYIVITVELPNK